jgi:hypothetical protein
MQLFDTLDLDHSCRPREAQRSGTTRHADRRRGQHHPLGGGLDAASHSRWYIAGVV